MGSDTDSASDFSSDSNDELLFTPKKNKVKKETKSPIKKETPKKVASSTRKSPRTRRASTPATKEKAKTQPVKKTATKKATTRKTVARSVSPKVKSIPKPEDIESDYEDSLPLVTLYNNLETNLKKRPRSASKSATSPPRKRKKSAAERQEEEMPEYKWWLEDDKDRDPNIRWKTLSHNGVVFPPPYKPLPKNIKLLYEGKPVDLPPEAEEIACFYAVHYNSTGAIKHTENPTFNKNFFEDFLAVLNEGKKKSDKQHFIKDLKKCDFTKIADYLAEQREIRKNRSKEEKEKEKEEKQALRDKYGFAIVDGRKEKVGNYTVEPPGLFLGRGKHPKVGRVKKRIFPEDVTINVSADAEVPECPLEGHKWKEIVHDPTVSWLAYWRENINDSSKYVWLAPSSAIKGRADREKFEVARRLKDSIKTIRKDYTKALTDDDEATRQMATAIFLIDKLALRVGNEKGEEEADTVGCCSLRVEHITPVPPKTLEFDFLGKDSMRYQNAVEVPEKVFKNIQSFRKGKCEESDLFHLLTTTKLNSYLKKLMPGLTAKVFRTYNASITLQNELAKIDTEKFVTVEEKVLFYNRANRIVAELCNHQRTLPKTHDSQMEKLDAKIDEIKEELAELKSASKLLKQGVEPPSPKEGESPRKRIPKDSAKLKKRIQTVKDSLQRWEIKKIEKEENKAFSTTTSKMNYLDPRITVAWCKKYDVDISRIFSKTIRQKFPWAMDSDADYVW